MTNEKRENTVDSTEECVEFSDMVREEKEAVIAFGEELYDQIFS